MDFCTDEEHSEVLRWCPEFEQILLHSGVVLSKYWFSVSDEEKNDGFRNETIIQRLRWIECSRAKDTIFAHTDIKQAPRYVVNGDVKKRARLNVIAHLLSLIDYEGLTAELFVCLNVSKMMGMFPTVVRLELCS